MKTQSADDTTYWMLLQTAIRAKHDIARLGEKYHLTVMQFVTLCSLQPGKAAPMSFVSSLLACDASNVTGIVERLVAGGYIIREESTDDRRVKVIQLTPTGEKLRETGLYEITATHPDSMTNLTDDEYKTFSHLLQKVLAPLVK